MATTSITKEFFVIDQKAFERMKRDLDKKTLLYQHRITMQPPSR